MDNQQQLESRIAEWRKQLRKHAHLEDGVVSELEDHLRQSIDRKMEAGQSAGSAFHDAVVELGSMSAIDREEEVARSRRSGNALALLGNYVLVALRNIRRRKLIASINVLGLTIAVAVSLLLGTYAFDIITYDQFHENASNIHFLYRTRPTPEGGQLDVSDTWPPLAEEVQKAFPAVEDICRISFAGRTTLRVSGKEFQERAAFSEQGLFNMFSFPLEKGNRERVFENPRSVVLSKEVARRLFGDADPVGQTIEIDLNSPVSYEVTGVLGTIPFNSSFQFDVIINLESRKQRWLETGAYGWEDSFMLSFVELRDGYDPAQLRGQLHTIVDKFVVPSERGTLELLPLASYYAFNTGRQQYGYFLGALAAGLLLIAFFNFANLNAAQSLTRSKEVAVRKTFGAGRNDLVLQFTGETILLLSIGCLLGIGLAFFLLPHFIDLFGQQMTLSFLINPLTAAVVLALVIVLGVLAGVYPTLRMARIQAGTANRGNTPQGKRGFNPKNALVTCQFAIAVMMVSAVLIVYQQISFMKGADMNFDPDNLVVINGRSADGDEGQQRWAAFRNSLEALAGVQSVSASNSVPGRYSGSFTLVQADDARHRPPLDWRYVNVDDQYFSTLGIDMMQGRNFDRGLASDVRKVIINEAALKQLGWASVEGRKLMFPDTDDGLDVIGVVKDFNYQSLATAVQPVMHVFRGHDSDRYSLLLVRLQPGSISETIDAIENEWNQYDASHPITYSFLDQDFQTLYENEERMGTMTLYATFVAIVIAVLGILGLASFTVVERMKEMAIRKVLGASVGQLLTILLRQSTLLLLISLAVAIPLNYYVMSDWLEDFAFRIDIGLLVYVLAATLVMITSWLVLGGFALKSLKTNPAKTLRSE